MMPPGQLAERRLTAFRRYEQFGGPEIILGLTADRYAKDIEDRAVKGAARRQVGDHKLDMIDQPPAVQQLRFHGRLPSCPRRTRKTASRHDASHGFRRVNR